MKAAQKIKSPITAGVAKVPVVMQMEALECGAESLVISLCRQVLFVLPPVWVLTHFVTGSANVACVWWPLALGEAATLIVALVLYGLRAKKRIDF